MTKQDIANRIARRLDIPYSTATKSIEIFLDAVIESIVRGETVELRGFGTFKGVHRAEKLARNITRNEPIVIPAYKKPILKPSKTFVERINVKHLK